MAKVEPTEYCKRAFKEIVEKGGKKGKSIVKAGYAKSTAHTPTKVTKTLGWKQLMVKHLSDKKLSKVHDDGLKAKRNGKPDHAVRHKYLDTAYKLKGKYAPEKLELEVDEKVDKSSKKYKDYMLWRSKQSKE